MAAESPSPPPSPPVTLSPETAAARHRSPFSFREKAGRMLWSVTEATLFRWTWPTWYRYRARLLRLFGADVHPASRIRRTCRFMCPWNLSVGAHTTTGEDVWFYCLGPVTIGERVTLSHFAKICAGSHDIDDPVLITLRRPSITVKDDAWVATGAFVGPNVTLGEGSILGACAVTLRDTAPWKVYAGNPAVSIKPRPHPSRKPLPPPHP